MFSPSTVLLRSAPTNDPDDGLASGTGAEERGSKAAVFLPWSLRDAES